MIEGTWAVRYDTGEIVSQYDVSHPAFHKVPDHQRGGEIPYRAIEWARTTEIVFESDFAKSTFAVVQVPGHRSVLKSRTFMVSGEVNGLSRSGEIRCFMICVERADAVVDLDKIDTVIAATGHVTYWFPDGSVHNCPHYDCPDVGQWIQDQVMGKNTGLMPATTELHTNVTYVT